MVTFICSTISSQCTPSISISLSLSISLFNATTFYANIVDTITHWQNTHIDNIHNTQIDWNSRRCSSNRSCPSNSSEVYVFSLGLAAPTSTYSISHHDQNQPIISTTPIINIINSHHDVHGKWIDFYRSFFCVYKIELLYKCSLLQRVYSDISNGYPFNTNTHTYKHSYRYREYQIRETRKPSYVLYQLIMGFLGTYIYFRLHHKHTIDIWW